MDDGVKATLAIVLVGILAIAAIGIYVVKTDSNERTQCIQSGGEPGPEHKCSRFRSPVANDK